MTEFREWLRRARRGHVFVYHIGMLPNDRERDWEVDQVAQEAWSVAEAGEVLLTQRRLESGKYEYIATRA